jgi:uncharacterized hydantoinase/oxoprolinase family protein
MITDVIEYAKFTSTIMETINYFLMSKGEKIMETNEIMTNEVANNQVIETVADEVIAEVENKSGLKTVVGVGLGVLIGVLIYKYAGRPIIANIRARKNKADDENIDAVDENDDDFDDVFDDDVEEK